MDQIFLQIVKDPILWVAFGMFLWNTISYSRWKRLYLPDVSPFEVDIHKKLI